MLLMALKEAAKLDRTQTQREFSGEGASTAEVDKKARRVQSKDSRGKGPTVSMSSAQVGPNFLAWWILAKSRKRVSDVD